MNTKIFQFAFVSGFPAVLLLAGIVLGTFWFWAAFAYLTVLIFLLDSINRHPANPQPGGSADLLSVALALVHFALFAMAVWSISGATGLTAGERLVAFFAFGLYFGQVSNSNAHELIHRPTKMMHWLGAWVFISHLFGHHTSAHRLVHHQHVATLNDPNTARWGQSFYRFAPKAWRRSFIQGFRAESQRTKRFNPYLIYAAGSVLLLLGSWFIAGFGGVATHVGLAIYATVQLLVSDYVQHYGLRRKFGPDGRPEPVAPRHSWDSPHRFSSLLMLNAPRHSDHHIHPARPFPALEFSGQAPVLPYSLPVMGLIAWSPRLWRRLMDTRLAEFEATQPKGST